MDGNQPQNQEQPRMLYQLQHQGQTYSAPKTVLNIFDLEDDLKIASPEL